MPEQRLPVIAWRLRVLMAERGIHTARALGKRLAEYGVIRSEPQLGRILRALPRSMDMHVLAALCAVLDATPGDLLIIPGKRALTTHNSTVAKAFPASSALAPTPSASEPVDPTTVPADRPRATVFPRPRG